MENTKCKICLNVHDIYGSTETVAPWLCQCRTPPRQSSLPEARIWEPQMAEGKAALVAEPRPPVARPAQQTVFFKEKRKGQTIRILVPKMSERQRREAKAAMLLVKPNNRQERF